MRNQLGLDTHRVASTNLAKVGVVGSNPIARSSERQAESRSKPPFSGYLDGRESTCRTAQNQRRGYRLLCGYTLWEAF